MDDLALPHRILGDANRLRALRLLARGELAVGELAEALAAAQSGVSRTLASFREAGFVTERRDGRRVLYSVPAAVRLDPRWAAVFDAIDAAPDDDGDLARLQAVLRARRERGEEEGGRAFVPGRSWAAWARALTHLVPRGLRAADLGCGDGALTLEIARFAESVVGVDARDAALRRARANATRRGIGNVRFVAGDFAAPPLPARSFDLVVLSQALHATDDPDGALAAARALLRRGGRVLVLDLFPHDEAWVRARLGHRTLGFTPEDLRARLRAAGFREIRTERAAGRLDEPFRVLLATGTVTPGAARSVARTASRAAKRSSTRGTR